jgi:hypothetical protein
MAFSSGREILLMIDWIIIATVVVLIVLLVGIPFMDWYKGEL